MKSKRAQLVCTVAACLMILVGCTEFSDESQHGDMGALGELHLALSLGGTPLSPVQHKCDFTLRSYDIVGSCSSSSDCPALTNCNTAGQCVTVKPVGKSTGTIYSCQSALNTPKSPLPGCEQGGSGDMQATFGNIADVIATSTKTEVQMLCYFTDGELGANQLIPIDPKSAVNGVITVELSGVVWTRQSGSRVEILVDHTPYTSTTTFTGVDP